ncbi:hypothetical protein [Sandarakinorhabdus sp.]|uniref:hypothetical protein n=1 Tax=Sandarakinorhabdus sp. TaxID=1916663 RepID=UPI00286D8EF6|nr:hypothetical protein [Sandarakinorhabdus sp.]
MTPAPDIFLSYNREDQARAKLFADAFAAAGLGVWWDTALNVAATGGTSTMPNAGDQRS